MTENLKFLSVVVFIYSIVSACGNADSSPKTRSEAAIREFIADAQSIRSVDLRRGNQVITCMKQEGFSYAPSPRIEAPQVGGGSSFGYFYVMQSSAQLEFGFGVTLGLIDSAFQQDLISKSLAGQPKQFGERLSLCEKKASVALRKSLGYLRSSFEASSIVQAHLSAARKRFESQLVARQALESWASCMKDAGISAKVPPDAQRLVDEETNRSFAAISLAVGETSGAIGNRLQKVLNDKAVAGLLKRELQIASAQSECTVRSGLSKLERSYNAIQDDEFTKEAKGPIPSIPRSDEDNH